VGGKEIALGRVKRKGREKIPIECEAKPCRYWRKKKAVCLGKKDENGWDANSPTCLSQGPQNYVKGRCESFWERLSRVGATGTAGMFGPGAQRREPRKKLGLELYLCE